MTESCWIPPLQKESRPRPQKPQQPPQPQYTFNRRRKCVSAVRRRRLQQPHWNANLRRRNFCVKREKICAAAADAIHDKLTATCIPDEDDGGGVCQRSQCSHAIYITFFKFWLLSHYSTIQPSLFQFSSSCVSKNSSNTAGATYR